MYPADAGPPTTLQEVFEQAMALDAPLGEQLAALSAGFRLARPQVLAAYDRLVARLEAAKLGNTGPRLGEPLPDFVLPDQDGRLTSLEDLLDQGPLVVSFNRGHWCQFCRLETQALAKAHASIAALGAGLVSIVPERAEFSRQFRVQNDLTFPVLSDIDLGYALTAGLVIWIGEELQKLYPEAGVDLALFHGNGGTFLPLPATFVVGQDGLVKARYVDPDFRRRMAIEDILAALAAIREPQAVGSPQRQASTAPRRLPAAKGATSRRP